VLVVVAAMLLTALVAGGVTLGLLQLQSRTNPQTINLRAGVSISQDSAIVQVAARAKPAVVSVVTHQQPSLAGGSGYLVTSDGYIVTTVDVIAGASALTVLIDRDAKLHDARLVDYDCQTGVAVIKIDQVSGLPTLVFADPTAVVQGQVLVAVGGPLGGGPITPGYISSLHRTITIPDPVTPGGTVEISDTIQTSTVIDAGSAGGPLLNVGGQVIAIAMQSPGSSGGFGLNVADVQDDVQQIVQSGQLIVSSLGGSVTDLSPEVALLSGLPEGSQLVSVDKAGPAAAAGLKPGDVITQLDDVKIDAAHPLRLLLRSRFHPNQRVTVTYTRAGTSTQVQLTLVGQHPACG
jgi:putative serine protease PepD